jgi:hypothetical protein
LASKKLNEESEKFWRFKSFKVLQLLNLHFKRRARLLIAFSFQHYKYQVQRAKVAQLQQFSGEIQLIERNIFQGQLKGGYLTLDNGTPEDFNED